MNKASLIKATTWDSAVLGMPAWELLEYTAVALQQAAQTRGHHTLKVDPTVDKRLLHDFGFYYCDTLIEPYCDATRFRASRHINATISKQADIDQMLEICHGAFSHDRFHRDYKLTKAVADQRYDNWLCYLLKKQRVYGLYWCDEPAGFIAYDGNKLLLHALAMKYRSKGLSKYWWSEVCCQLFGNGHDIIKSSISMTNLPVLNLYISLGFSFENPLDIYHLLVP